MIQLPNGCRCSEIAVSPKNWNGKGASMKVTWKLRYRFYDPINCPAGHPVEIKNGLNRLKTLDERRALVAHLLNFERSRLVNDGFNPKTNVSTPPVTAIQFIEPSTPFITALKEAHKKIDVSKRTFDDLTAIIRTVGKAAGILNLHYVPVSEVKRKHIKAILDQVGRISKSWSSHNYNKYRTYLMILYKELMEQEAVDANIIKDISTRKKVKTIRAVLTTEQREELNVYLKEKYYRFWLFLNIFFHSGSRISEIMLLKGSGVNLANQKFKITVLKGSHYKEVEHTIKNVALPYWNEVMEGCKDDDYVFSEGLKPGAKAIRSDQITKRWYRLVKQKLGITSDFYALRHLSTTETVEILGAADAAKHNSHTSTDMVAKVYDINSKERLHQRLKEVNNTF